jgi:hypothetical protein
LSGRTYLEPCTRMTTSGNAEVLDAMSKFVWFNLLVSLICRPNNDMLCSVPSLTIHAQVLSDLRGG